MQIRPWRHVAGPGQRTSISASNRVVMTDDDPVNARILSLVVDLGNTVLTKRAASDLHRCVFGRYRVSAC